MRDGFDDLGVRSVAADRFALGVGGADGSLIGYRLKMRSSEIARIENGPASDPSAFKSAPWADAAMLRIIDAVHDQPGRLFADAAFDEDGQIEFNLLIFDFVSDLGPAPGRRVAFAWFTHMESKIVPFPTDLVAQMRGEPVPLAFHPQE
jgi:hypothetical protein